MASRIDTAAGRAALDAARAALAAGERPARSDYAMGVRYLLQLLDEKAPGNSVEVRVPPFGAVQVVQGPRHPRHRRTSSSWIRPRGSPSRPEPRPGPPPSRRAVHASGTRADLTALLPLRP
jgi:hypothetical protein